MVVDLLIVISIGFAVFRGFKIGFIRQLCSTVGFFAGLFIGAWLQPHITSLAHSADARAALTMATILGFGLILMSAGEYLGIYLKHHLHLKLKRVNIADNGFGSVLSIITVILGVWLIASILNNYSFAGVQTAVRDSRIVALLNRTLPPAPEATARIGRLIDPNGFPDVFIGNEPIPRGDVDLPALGDLSSAVNATKDSVVRIRSQGCGGIVSGSGFVAGNNLVATNAHVVAGIQQPYIQDVNGSHQAKTVWFDPALDLAILRTSKLAGKRLAFVSAPVASGTPAAVLGYPNGGDFSAKPAVVLDVILAKGRDIYGTGHTLRTIYEIRADIVHGNSGGPLVDKDGSVVGVIFAESTNYNQVGYALTSSKVAEAVSQANSKTAAISTGRCAE